MTTDTIRFLESQVKCGEQWKMDHVRAMECANLEDIIKLGMSLYGIIRGIDDLWSRQVQSRATKFDPSVVEALEKAYNWWIKPCADIIKSISKFEIDGYKVAGAAELRDAHSTVRGILRTKTQEIIEGFAKPGQAA